MHQPIDIVSSTPVPEPVEPTPSSLVIGVIAFIESTTSCSPVSPAQIDNKVVRSQRR